MEIQCKGKCNTLTVSIASKSIFSPFFFLSLPFDLKKFKSLDFFDFLFPFPPLPGGKIIQKNKRALLFIYKSSKIEERCFEESGIRETSQSICENN